MDFMGTDLDTARNVAPSARWKRRACRSDAQSHHARKGDDAVLDYRSSARVVEEEGRPWN